MTKPTVSFVAEGRQINEKTGTKPGDSACRCRLSATWHGRGKSRVLGAVGNRVSRIRDGLAGPPGSVRARFAGVIGRLNSRFPASAGSLWIGSAVRCGPYRAPPPTSSPQTRAAVPGDQWPWLEMGPAVGQQRRGRSLRPAATYAGSKSHPFWRALSASISLTRQHQWTASGRRSRIRPPCRKDI